MIKEKKVSFRVRRIYYDQFANGTKQEELRTLKQYWVSILCPYVPEEFEEHPEVMALDFPSIKGQPSIAIIHTPKFPALEFKICKIFIERPEYVLGRDLSEQGKQDITTELCIVTKMLRKCAIGED